jgi:hypothetical protein
MARGTKNNRSIEPMVQSTGQRNVKENNKFTINYLRALISPELFGKYAIRGCKFDNI